MKLAKFSLLISLASFLFVTQAFAVNLCWRTNPLNKSTGTSPAGCPDTAGGWTFMPDIDSATCSGIPTSTDKYCYSSSGETILQGTLAICNNGVLCAQTNLAIAEKLASDIPFCGTGTNPCSDIQCQKEPEQGYSIPKQNGQSCDYLCTGAVTSYCPSEPMVPGAGYDYSGKPPAPGGLAFHNCRPFPEKDYCINGCLEHVRVFEGYFPEGNSSSDGVTVGFLNLLLSVFEPTSAQAAMALTMYFNTPMLFLTKTGKPCNTADTLPSSASGLSSTPKAACPDKLPNYWTCTSDGTLVPQIPAGFQPLAPTPDIPPKSGQGLPYRDDGKKDDGSDSGSGTGTTTGTSTGTGTSPGTGTGTSDGSNGDCTGDDCEDGSADNFTPPQVKEEGLPSVPSLGGYLPSTCEALAPVWSFKVLGRYDLKIDLSLWDPVAAVVRGLLRFALTAGVVLSILSIFRLKNSVSE